MKCLCGYEEPVAFEKSTPIYWQSGKRKGELKTVRLEWIEPEEEDKFIPISIEKGFSFTKREKSWGDYYERECSLYACPKCGTARLEI